MSFLPQEPITYINIKLTDAGRKLLSLGQLTFDRAVFSDREINYGIDYTGYYDIECSNRVLSPVDVQPFINTNLDGSASIPVYQVGSLRQIVSANTASTGFFSGYPENWVYDNTAYIARATVAYSGASTIPSGGTIITLRDYSGATLTGLTPTEMPLVYIPWQTIQNSGNTYALNDVVLSANPTVALWYRVLTATTAGSSVTLSLDRDTPNFNNYGQLNITTNQRFNCYFYPNNGVYTYYGSASTVETKVWNMSIVRTSSQIGTDNTISGYTTYGSIQYNGFKHYIGFSAETREVGIIHYSNNYTGNTYAEQLVEGTTELTIPNVMWHKYPTTNVGEAINYGITLYDYAGPTIFDTAAQTTYRFLRDGTSTGSTVVGRVYHKLKTYVITDPELLTALTYKSNRNYTVPPIQVQTSSVPAFPLTSSQATGILETGYTYFVTYNLLTKGDYYLSGSSFGYPVVYPCAYIARIDGQLDGNGNPLYLKADFPSNSFPYMRKSQNTLPSSPYSGTGWVAGDVQLMVNKVDLSIYPNVNFDTIPSDNWTLFGVGNGNITAQAPYDLIDPLYLQGSSMIVSNEDLQSGTTYSLTGAYSGLSMNMSALTYGDEAFFFGNVKVGIMATTYKSIITVLCPNTDYNASINGSFDPLLNPDTYITEIGVLNNNNQLVAVGKPTYPIPKNSSRYLTFQLELDF